jgi:hypothetical protein
MQLAKAKALNACLRTWLWLNSESFVLRRKFCLLTESKVNLAIMLALQITL